MFSVRCTLRLARPGAAGLLMNKTMYNIVRVFVLSACSALLSEVLGFKFKAWKLM